jgi:hypothetical protein
MRKYVMSRLWVTTEGVLDGNWIYWLLLDGKYK